MKHLQRDLDKTMGLSEDLVLFSSTKMNIVKSLESVVLLQRLYGNNSSFRSVFQQQAADSVLFKNEDLICILPTGSGKVYCSFSKPLRVPTKVLF